MTTPTITPLQIDYIDPDGNDWNLSDLTMQNGYICSSIVGIEGLPTAMQLTPLIDGTAYTDFYIPQPGTITIAILVGVPQSNNENDYYALLDRIAHAFYTRRNQAPAPGWIMIQRPDGTSRQIQVYTTSGLDTPETEIHYTLYTLTLQTPDPFWYDEDVNQLVFQTSAATGILPILPVYLAGSSVIGASSVENTGGTDAYPLWTITGPGTPTMINNTTGRQWSLNTSIPAGHVVQVQTHPGQQSCVDTTTSTNIWNELVLSSPRDLWSLMSGDNEINIAMVGATPATSVALTWQNRWLRA